MSSQTSPSPVTPDTLKAGHRTMWASGDYSAVAECIDDTPPAALLRELGALEGRNVLDVATGTGNLALRAAAAGASVTGLDLVQELLDIAREREPVAGDAPAIAWVAGDAEALPFPDASFDVVTSIFGIQFAPRHAVTAGELVRVLRPGGTLGLVNWTPEGMVGQMFAVLGQHLPKPPAFVSPPPSWGDEAHVRELLGDAVTELTFTRGVNPFRFPSTTEFATFMEDRYGPTLTAKAKLGPEAWAACAEGLLAVYDRCARSAGNGNGLAIESEFVVITARRA
jgi:SAM-dependent methyltransferase